MEALFGVFLMVWQQVIGIGLVLEALHPIIFYGYFLFVVGV